MTAVAAQRNRDIVIDTYAQLDALKWAGVSEHALDLARQDAEERLEAIGILIDEVTALDC